MGDAGHIGLGAPRTFVVVPEKEAARLESLGGKRLEALSPELSVGGTERRPSIPDGMTVLSWPTQDAFREARGELEARGVSYSEAPGPDALRATFGALASRQQQGLPEYTGVPSGGGQRARGVAPAADAVAAQSAPGPWAELAPLDPRRLFLAALLGESPPRGGALDEHLARKAAGLGTGDAAPAAATAARRYRECLALFDRGLLSATLEQLEQNPPRALLNTTELDRHREQKEALVQALAGPPADPEALARAADPRLLPLAESLEGASGSPPSAEAIAAALADPAQLQRLLEALSRVEGGQGRTEAEREVQRIEALFALVPRERLAELRDALRALGNRSDNERQAYLASQVLSKVVDRREAPESERLARSAPQAPAGVKPES